MKMIKKLIMVIGLFCAYNAVEQNAYAQNPFGTTQGSANSNLNPAQIFTNILPNVSVGVGGGGGKGEGFVCTQNGQGIFVCKIGLRPSYNSPPASGIGATINDINTSGFPISTIPPEIPFVMPPYNSTGGGLTNTPQGTYIGSMPGVCGLGVDCSIEGDIIPMPSRTTPGGNNPFRMGRLNGPSYANALMNSYAAENVAAKCSNATPAITRLWQHNIDFDKYQSNGGNDYPFLAPNEAITFKFTAPEEGTHQIFQYNEGTQVTFVSGFMSISDKPCDFDVNKLVDGPGKSACFSSEIYGLSVYYRATTGAVAKYECKMIPGQTYYMNLRMQAARPVSQGGSPTLDSCASSGAGLCGGFIQIR